MTWSFALLAGLIVLATLGVLLYPLRPRAVRPGDDASCTGGTTALGQRRTHHWMWALAIALPLAAASLYLHLGAPHALTASSGASLDADQMIARLRAAQSAHPDAIDPARALSDALMSVGRYEEAVDVLSELARRHPDDAQTYADLADALGSAAGNDMRGEPERMLNMALQRDAGNVKALALAGTIAFDRQDYVRARDMWQKLVEQVDPASEFGRQARDMLAEAAARLDEAHASTAPQRPTQRIVGAVTLDDSLRTAVAAGDALFVFVRHADGGPPLAVQRYRSGAWPMRFDVDVDLLPDAGDDNATFVIVARVSKHGDAAAGSGDLEGISAPFGRDTGAIDVGINRRLP
ncbi:MAG: hypothetical protein QM639_11900 [Rhodocyclaceae bacterium]